MHNMYPWFNFRHQHSGVPTVSRQFSGAISARGWKKESPEGATTEVVSVRITDTLKAIWQIV